MEGLVPDISWTTILKEGFSRCTFIRRWGTSPTLYPHTVASHMWQCGIYAYIITEWLRGMGYSVDGEKVLVSSLLHDMEEMFSTDIPRPLKEVLPREVEESIKEASAKILEQYMATMLPPRIVNNVLVYHHHAKDKDTLEGFIVMVADIMCVAHEMWRELRVGNDLVWADMKTLRSLVERIESVEIFKPIANGIRLLMKEVNVDV